MKLGPYETTEILGRGGMAVVYKGMQQSLGRIVAIKVLPKEFSRDRQFVGRFHREAESVAKLNHPNIIQIIDKGEEAGTCFFVMEYVKGTSLGAKLANKGVTFKELVEIALQVCNALHYAHEQGVVHRDIKPANILLDDTTGVAKVADFGIAQLAEKSTAIGTLTGDHMAMGTLDYMSPEQKRDAKNVDRRADVYSMGVMMYEMATGRVPMGIFDPPSRINKSLPKDFDAIVMKCLRDKPDERYQSCLELSNVITQLPQNPSTMVRVITSMKSGVTNIGTQIGRRNPRYLMAIVVLLAGVGAGGFGIWKWSTGRKVEGGGPVDGGGQSGGVPVTNNGGGTLTDADKDYLKRKADADEKAAKGDLAAAMEIYSDLLEKTTGPRHEDVLRAIAEVKLQQDEALADEYLQKLQDAMVETSKATAETVKKLEDLLAEARRRKVKDFVLTQIAGAIERARTAVEKNAAAEKDRLRIENMHALLAKAQQELDEARFPQAEALVADASKLAISRQEHDECDAIAEAISSRKSATSSAEQKKADFDRSLVDAKSLMEQGKFSQARMKLKEAKGFNLGGDADARISELLVLVDRKEKSKRFAEKMDEAGSRESKDKAAAAALYREAAQDAPSDEDAAEANRRAAKLEASIEDERKEREYDAHMAAARKAMIDKEWKLAETEAVLALGFRKNDTEAASIRDEAHKQALAKPPDPPKDLKFQFKGVIKGKFDGVWSLSADAAGNVYALDRNYKKMFLLGPDGTITKETPLPPPFEYPDRVFIDAKGRTWVTEWGSKSKIALVDKDTFTVSKSLGSYGKGDGQFNSLTDAVISLDGKTAYGMDSKHFRVQAVDVETGAFTKSGGSLYSGKGTPDGFFRKTGYLAIDSNGMIYASDMILHTVQRFKPDLTFDSVFKTLQGQPGPMTWAKNRLYVADVEKFKIFIYSADGKELGSFGDRGKTDSQFCSIQSIAVTPDGKVWVADYGTRVEMFEEVK